MAALTGQRSAANEARTAAAEAHAVWEAHPLYPDDAAALERRAASIAPAKAPSLLLPAADGLLLAICAVLAVVFRAASPQRWIFAGMALLAAALTVFSVCLRRRAIRQEQERVDRDRAALAEQTASYLPLRDRAAQTDEAARRAGAILSGAEESCRSRLLTLLTQVQRFAPARPPTCPVRKSPCRTPAAAAILWPTPAAPHGRPPWAATPCKASCRRRT